MTLPLTRELTPDAEPHVETRGERRTMPDRRRVTRAYRSVDLVVSMSVLMAVAIAANHATMPSGLEGFLAMRVTVKNVVLLAACSAIWITSFTSMGAYDRRSRHARREKIGRTIMACALGSVGVFLFPLATAGHGALTYRTAVAYWVAVTIAVLAVRYATSVMNRAARRRVARRVIIVGSGPRAQEVARQLETDASTSYQVLGFVDDELHSSFDLSQSHALGRTADLAAIVGSTPLDEVHVALPLKSHYDSFCHVLSTCEELGVPAVYGLDAFTHRTQRLEYRYDARHPVAVARVVPEDVSTVLKRALDIAGALVLGLLFSPFILGTALLVRLTSPGPIIFSQQRLGRNKRRFKLYKFRSMVADAERVLAASPELRVEYLRNNFKLPPDRDPRLTLVGHFLRRTSLDELPQLWNVLRGDMSLVGPRPIVEAEQERYGNATSLLLALKPGLSGEWVVAGRSRVSYPKRAELELGYVRSWSLVRDLKIAARTIPAVFFGRGAH